MYLSTTLITHRRIQIIFEINMRIQHVSSIYHHVPIKHIHYIDEHYVTSITSVKTRACSTVVGEAK